MQVWFPFRYLILPLLACITSNKVSKCKYVQKPWFLQCSVTSCKFPSHLHRNAKHHERVPRFISKTNQHYSFILLKILLRMDNACDTMSRTKNKSSRKLRDASKTPPGYILGRLQNATGCLQAAAKKDALKSFANRHEASSRLQGAPKKLQDTSKTPKHASKLPLRGLQDGPRRRQGGLKTISVMKPQHFRVPQNLQSLASLTPKPYSYANLFQ